MAAKCYWCEEGKSAGSVPSPVGLRREPIGVCFSCHVLACGHHAERHPRRKVYQCFDCVSTTLIQSATLSLSVADKQNLILWDPIFIVILNPIFPFLFDSFEDFLSDTYGYALWMERIDTVNLSNIDGSYEFDLIVRKLAPDQKKMLVAAGIIIARMYRENPAYEWSPFVLIFRYLQ